MQTALLDPRIGVLNSGQFYAFAHGYDKPETVGTRLQVEQALGITKVQVPSHAEGKRVMSFYTKEALQRAAASGTLKRICEGSQLRAIGDSIYGFNNAVVTRCSKGLSLPDQLREGIELHLTKILRQSSGVPVTPHIVITPNEVFQGFAIGCWNFLRSTCARAVVLGIQTKAISDASWKGPDLRILGVDVEKASLVYEYVGEARR